MVLEAKDRDRNGGIEQRSALAKALMGSFASPEAIERQVALARDQILKATMVDTQAAASAFIGQMSASRFFQTASREQRIVAGEAFIVLGWQLGDLPDVAERSRVLNAFSNLLPGIIDPTYINTNPHVDHPFTTFVELGSHLRKTAQAIQEDETASQNESSRRTQLTEEDREFLRRFGAIDY